MPDEVQLFRRVIYNYLKAKIYRRTSRLPLHTAAERQICPDVCQNVIDSAKDMFNMRSCIRGTWSTFSSIPQSFCLMLVGNIAPSFC
ncbi:uncharacterized protein N7487_012083 [Penicillium crustosum]|uniref:uncharacterized protein n=1 Tax=Penicillium crustosum TaxID=36656 RepID=UPI0023A6798E|nr:uncharacterized protein N7487_012083 [Penicillium crustosum]KAJ5394442.1 hypothetical protein N7487_012083 [Penicillium crustosum]